MPIFGHKPIDECHFGNELDDGDDAFKVFASGCSLEGENACAKAVSDNVNPKNIVHVTISKVLLVEPILMFPMPLLLAMLDINLFHTEYF